MKRFTDYERGFVEHIVNKEENEDTLLLLLLLLFGAYSDASF